MRENIHPNYHKVTVVCACGNTFETGSTKEGDILKVDICSKCHPYFTGTQKIVDAGGKVERFMKRYGINKQLKIYCAGLLSAPFYVRKKILKFFMHIFFGEKS